MGHFAGIRHKISSDAEIKPHPYFQHGSLREAVAASGHRGPESYAPFLWLHWWLDTMVSTLSSRYVQWPLLKLTYLVSLHERQGADYVDCWSAPDA